MPRKAVPRTVRRRLGIVSPYIIALQCSYDDREVCSSIFGARWNKKDRAWRYPVTALPDILAAFPDVQMNPKLLPVVKELQRKQEAVNEIKRAEGVDYDTFLMQHQARCREIARVEDRFGMFLDTGTGKTVLGWQIIADNMDMKWLVICPKSIVKSAWLGDKDAFFPQLRALPLSKNIKAGEYRELARKWEIELPRRANLRELQQTLAPYAQTYIINPESFKLEQQFFKEQGVDGLIFDESVKLKDHSTGITKDTTRFAGKLRKVYLMSGKPAPNSPLEYFAQMRIIDPAIFGTSMFRFRERFFVQRGLYEWSLNPDLKELFAERLARKSIFVSKEECLDLPEKGYIKREVELTPRARKIYKQLELERVLDLGDVTLITPTKLTNIMKLRQITSGFVFQEDGTVSQLHKLKINELVEVLEEIGDNQVIIWINFQPEVDLIQETLLKMGKTVVTAYGKTRDLDANVAAFKEGRAQYMIANPRTLKYGVTFNKCNYTIYYSLSYSFDDYYQSHDRIYRKGQRNYCTFIFLLCPDTIDEAVFKIVHEKQELSKVIEEYVKGVI